MCRYEDLPISKNQLIVISKCAVTIRYDTVYLTCSKKLTCSQLSPPHGIKQEALLSQRGRAMLRVCIASIQNVERSLLLLVVSASDIPLRTIKFFSVLFSSAYSSML